MSNAPWIWWRGVRVTPQVRDAVLAAEQRAGFRFTLTQGGYNGGAVAASAGTHDSDAIDTRTRGLTRQQVTDMVEALRWAGFAAWFRTTSVPRYGTRAQGFASEHVHAVPNGWGNPSAGARRQAVAYRGGRDGLARNLADIGPGHTRAWVTRTSPRKPVAPGLPGSGVDDTPTPTHDTRTPLERLLDTMDEKTLGDLIYTKVAEFHTDNHAREVGRSQEGAWHALGSPPIPGRDDEWGASLRDSIARAAYRSGVAVTLLSQVLTALSTISTVDTAKLARELAPLIPGVQPSMTVEQIAAEVRREIGEALTES